MTPQELQERTLAFALAIYRFVRPLLSQADTRHVAQQLLRAATSVAANYRAACLARSSQEWTAKLGIVREEADEALFWLIFMQRSGLATSQRAVDADGLTDEARQISRIFGASYRTSRTNQKKVGRAKQGPPPQIDR